MLRYWRFLLSGRWRVRTLVLLGVAWIALWWWLHDKTGSDDLIVTLVLISGLAHFAVAVWAVAMTKHYERRIAIANGAELLEQDAAASAASTAAPAREAAPVVRPPAPPRIGDDPFRNPPAAPPIVVERPATAPAAVPRADTADPDDKPRFLR